MRVKFFIKLVMLIMVLSACTAPASDVPAVPQIDRHQKITDVSAPSIVATEISITSQERASLTMLAAASLTESFTELRNAFETKYPWITITFNFAGSQTLAEQLAQGAPADVFASANMKYFKALVEEGILNQDGSAIFAANRMVMIYPIEKVGISYDRNLSR